MGREGNKPVVIPLSVCLYLRFSPSLKNLMIVTESLTRGTKFVFNTSQVREDHPSGSHSTIAKPIL